MKEILCWETKYRFALLPTDRNELLQHGSVYSLLDTLPLSTLLGILVQHY